MNTVGTLFGGQLLSWFDEESALYVYNCLSDDCAKKMTSVCVYSFNFLKPAFEGDRIRSLWEVVHFGNSSITVKGVYEKDEVVGTTHKWVKMAQGYSCLCAIDDDGKPTSYTFKPEIDVEKIKAGKDWEIVEKLKALTKLNK